MTYFLTWPCYGSHMHGAAEGSVDRNHNRYGAPLARPNRPRLLAELELMDQPPYELDEARRQSALEATIIRCNQAAWQLLAAHVRSNHVHVIIQAKEKSEFVLAQLKSAASRRLNALRFDDPTRKRWARHGSTRRLFNDESIQQAISYVVERQGRPMAVIQADRSRWSRF
jgi:REP element-mobilizing transposase RayT